MAMRKRLASLSRPFRRWITGRSVIAERMAALRPPATRGQHYFPLEPDAGLARLNAGPLLFVDPLDEHVCVGIIVHGWWEPWVSAVVLSLLRPGARVVEVGANVGYYTMIMANRVGPTGHVTALEPNPRLIGLLGRSTRLNGFSDRVRLEHRAAMDVPGSIDFVSYRLNGGGGHVPFVADAYHDPLMGTPEKHRVEAVRIDDLDCGPVDMIRIDAEGTEPFILRGAAETLKANPDVILCMEWSVVQMESRTSVPDLVDWLEELGFRFWLIGPPTGLTPLTRAELLAQRHCDVVASRRPPVPT